jgi:hypothetical protein
VNWLGLSIRVLTCPLAIGLAIRSVWNGTHRWFAFPALILSGLEMFEFWLPAAMTILEGVMFSQYGQF